MVNFQRIAYFILGDAAVTAAVVVTLSGLSAACSPVFAAIAFMSPFPGGGVFTLHILRLPLPHTRCATEVMTVNVGLTAPEPASTPFAVQNTTPPAQMHNPTFSAASHSLGAPESIMSVGFCWELLSTHRASFHVLLLGEVLISTLPIAEPTAGLVVLNTASRPLHILTTAGTLYDDGVLTHEAIIPDELDKCYIIADENIGRRLGVSDGRF